MRSAMEVARAALEAAPWEPQSWGRALQLTAGAAGFECAHLIGASSAFKPTFSIEGGLPEGVYEAWMSAGGVEATGNPRAAAVFRAPYGAVFSDDDYISAAARQRHPLYREVYRPFDVDFSAVARFSLGGGAFGIATFMQKDRGQELQTSSRRVLQRLLPVMAQSARIQIQLGAHSVRLAAEALGGGVPAWFCDTSGMVLALSAAADALCRAGDLLTIRGGRLRSAEPEDDRQLCAAIRAVAAGQDGRSVVLFGNPFSGPHRVEVVPTRKSGFGSAGVTVLLWPRSQLARVLRQFGLTAAEAQVAEALCSGQKPVQIALGRRVSIETVRSQIRAIHQKLGVRHAGELMALVRGL